MEVFKQNLRKEADFLASIYNSRTKHYLFKNLDTATVHQLNILVRVINLILQGQIPVEKKRWTKGVRISKKVAFLDQHFSEDQYKSLLSEDRVTKLKILKNISVKCYHALLYRLFF